MELSVFIATSLDGFIARSNGALDWLHGSGEAAPGSDYGYQSFFDSVDALVMGRGTFDVVRAFPRWPYGTKPVVVLSSRSLPIPAELRRSVEHVRGSPIDIVARLESRGWRHVYVDGGKTIQAFLAAGLINRMIISRLPLLLGSGIPLFGPLPADVRLEHVRTVPYAGGMVQSEYRVVSI